MDIRLIALDLDGTALNSHGELDKRTLKAFDRAAASGITIAAATGRAFCALPKALFHVSSLEYAITFNGTGIYRLSDGACLYSNRMTEDSLSPLLALLDTYPCPIEIFVDGQAYGPWHYVKHPEAYHIPERSSNYIRATRTPVDDMASFLAKNRNHIEGIDFVITDMALKKEIRSAAEQIPNLYVTSSVPHYLEFAAGGASKQTALAHFLSILGLSPSQVMAFGDGENDLEMITFAGLGIAMGNAEPQLKEAADYVTDTNDAYGVAKAIEHFLF